MGTGRKPHTKGLGLENANVETDENGAIIVNEYSQTTKDNIYAVVIGIHIVGDDSPEMIQALGICVKAGLTKADFDQTCAVHPTIAEEIVTLKPKEPNKTTTIS